MISGIQSNQAAALLIGLVACVFDLRSGRIPNLLTFGGAALAIGYAVAARGAGGLLSSVGGWATGLILFLPMFLLKGMGAGDVKLIACLGAWVGPHDAFWLAIYSMIAGGVMAVAVALATGYTRQAAGNVWAMLSFWRVMGVRPLPELTLATARGPRLPYALPIAAGTLAVIWIG